MIHHTVPENSKQIFSDMKLRGLVPSYSLPISVSNLYIPTIGLPTLLYCICGPILVIYKSLTDT
jgi:hypothetical protein